MLRRAGATVRGLVLPAEKVADAGAVRYFKGDVRDKATLEPLFADTDGRDVVVIHTAGIVDIADKVSPAMYAVNVGGTRNITALCLEHRVSRLVYVSSVHAIPEKDGLQVLREVHHFSPDEVVGGYAKTKAEATQIVLDAAAAGRQVMQLFRQLHDEGRTIIMITHDVNIAANAQRIVHILDGRLWEGDPPPEGETAGAGAEGGGADV